MDPVTIIVAALVAGAAAATKDVAAQAVRDGYNGLKALVVRKFGQKADVAPALVALEKKPDSGARQEVLKEELTTAGAGEDAEVVQQAQRLVDLLKEQGLITGPSYQAVLHGSGAIAQGPGAVAAGSGGVAIGGDVRGGEVRGGEASGDDNKVKK